MSSTTTPLDPSDYEIIRLLRGNGRLGGSEIARRINLSQPAVSARIKRLEERGVITGYHADVNYLHLGHPIHAVVRLRTTQAQIAAALDLFARLPEITCIYRITGEDCFLLDLHATHAERLEAVVDAIAKLGPATTALVLREYPAHDVPAEPPP